MNEWGIQEPGDDEPCQLFETEEQARSHLWDGDRLLRRTVGPWVEVEEK